MRRLGEILLLGTIVAVVLYGVVMLIIVGVHLAGKL